MRQGSFLKTRHLVYLQACVFNSGRYGINSSTMRELIFCLHVRLYVTDGTIVCVCNQKKQSKKLMTGAKTP